VSLAGAEVGTLAETPQREIFFEYASDWIRDGFSISPYHLPLAPGLKQETTGVFGGLFGTFDDSIPDGWGLLLMDRFFGARGIRPETLSPLDRLAYVGCGGMGALEYHPEIEGGRADRQWMDLAEVAAQAERIVTGSAEEALPALRAAGGSSGGSRPKGFVAYHPSSGRMSSDVLQPGAGFEHWLVKFRAKEDPEDAGCIEAAYAEMAKAAGIQMPPTRLFDTRAGRFFGIQRFDRKPGGIRTHTHTFGGLIHSNFRHPNRDYQDFLFTVFSLTKDFQQVEQAFRRVVFNVIAHNRDDHVRNFAFLADKNGRWRLSPAYDIVWSSGVRGQHNMTVMGSGTPGTGELLKLAEDAGIGKKRAKELIAESMEAVRNWGAVAEKFGVSRKSQQVVGTTLLSLA
jgi:serine/threonine-protein kinase HipA